MIVLNHICRRPLAAIFLENSRMKGDRQAGMGVGGGSPPPPPQFSFSSSFEFWSHTGVSLKENKELNPLILKILLGTYVALSRNSKMSIV